VFEPDDVVELRLIPSRRQSWHTAAELPGLFGQLSAANHAGENIYAGVNPRRERGGSTASDVRLARCLCADWDGHSLENVQRIIDTARLPPPTLRIHSGHGFHAYWKLLDPVADLTQWTILQKRLIATVNSDPIVHDAPRIMRLPGFWNRKEQPFVPCYIVAADPAQRYPLATLANLLRPLSLVSQTSGHAGLRTTGNEWIDLLRGVGQGGRHNALVRLVGHFLGHGLPGAEVAVICHFWNERNQPPLPEAEVDRAATDLAERRRAAAENQVFRNRPRPQTLRLQLP
jgi:hypothetical protein